MNHIRLCKAHGIVYIQMDRHFNQIVVRSVVRTSVIVYIDKYSGIPCIRTFESTNITKVENYNNIVVIKCPMTDAIIILALLSLSHVDFVQTIVS